MNAPLAELFRYNRWANRTLFGACRGLSDAQLEARVPGVSGTVRELLLHTAGGQQTLVLRTQGRQHEGELNRDSAWPGFDALIDIVTRTSDDLIRIAESLDADRDVDLPWLGKRFRYPTSFFLAHALEHGVEHRTEIKLALAQCGVETPDLDAWQYAAWAGYGREVE
ncbi:MAG TPA: DinB family protein [Thermomicrobiaceae bacterium]|nr:DinB family protein [Thermomicrobiaceae bacterium]